MKPKHKRLQAKADKLWSSVIKKSGRCAKCGSRNVIAPHHIIYRSQSNLLRCDWRNGIPLCRGCHFWIHHESPTIVSEWLEDKLGYDRIEYLNSKRHKVVKANSAFWQEKIDELEEMI